MIGFYIFLIKQQVVKLSLIFSNQKFHIPKIYKYHVTKKAPVT